MKKFKFIFPFISIVLFYACSSDDFNSNDSELRGQKITIRASLDNLNTTKAGIEEGNSNYEAGESFYWKDGDTVMLYFVKEGAGSAAGSSTFETLNSQGKVADFTGEIPVNLPDGMYTVYATKELTPTSTNSLFLSANQEIDQKQEGISSNGIPLPMLSLAIKNIEIKEGKIQDETQLDFSLKQLNALLRFSFINQTDQAMTVEKIDIHIENATSGKVVNRFSKDGTVWLQGKTESEDIKWTRSTTTSVGKLSWSNSKTDNSNIAVGGTFDAYVSMIPITKFSSGIFVAEIQLRGANGKTYQQTKKIDVSKDGDFAFIKTSGFEGGKRYYFVDELKAEDLRGISIVTFEDEAGSNYWASLIDSDQALGPLLYYSGDPGIKPYEWKDKESGLYSKINDLDGDGEWQYYLGGIAISNYKSTDLKKNNSSNEQLTLYGDKGHNGSDKFAVVYGYEEMLGSDYIPRLSFPDGPKTIDHMYVAPTCFFYAVAKNGNEMSPAVEEGSVWITATGYLNEKKTKTVTLDLIQEGYINLKTWTKWDLSSLGKIDKVVFDMKGMGDDTRNNQGFSIPAYFAIDDIMVID